MVAEFLGLTGNSSFTESQLEQRLLNHLQKFLMKLGKGYAFVSRQQHIATKRFFNDRKVIRQPTPYKL